MIFTGHELLPSDSGNQVPLMWFCLPLGVWKSLRSVGILGDGYGPSLMWAFSQPHPSIETPLATSHAAPVNQREDWKLSRESMPKSRGTVSAHIFPLISPRPTQSKDDFPTSYVRVELRTVRWLLKTPKRSEPHLLNRRALDLLLDPSASQRIPRWLERGWWSTVSGWV